MPPLQSLNFTILSVKQFETKRKPSFAVRPQFVALKRVAKATGTEVVCCLKDPEFRLAVGNIAGKTASELKLFAVRFVLGSRTKDSYFFQPTVFGAVSNHIEIQCAKECLFLSVKGEADNVGGGGRCCEATGGGSAVVDVEL